MDQLPVNHITKLSTGITPLQSERNYYKTITRKLVIGSSFSHWSYLTCSNTFTRVITFDI